MAGTITGSIAPLALGGAGAILRKGAKEGAKGILKRGTAEAFETIGKAPSAQVFRLAEKTGKQIKKGAESLGVKNKTALKATELAGDIFSFASIESAIQGVKAVKRDYEEKEFKTTKDVMNSVMGSGFARAGETFMSTTAWTAGLWGVGKAITGVGKGSS